MTCLGPCRSRLLGKIRRAGPPTASRVVRRLCSSTKSSGARAAPALLQLLNERTWPDGSRNRPARLVSAVAATNALRDADDDDDDALFDRFLFRRAVAPVSDAGALDLLLTPTTTLTTTTPALTSAAEGDALRARATLPRRRAAVLASCRAWLRDERGEYVSDRRLRRCSEAIRAAALACGRTEVGAIDLLLAADALWQRPETRAPLVDWLVDHAVPDDAATMRLLLDALRARDAPSEQDAEEIVAAATTAARTDLAADAAARKPGKSACSPRRRRWPPRNRRWRPSTPSTVRARRRPRKRDGARRPAPGERAPVAEDSAGCFQRVESWDDDGDDDESDGKKKRKKEEEEAVIAINPKLC